MNAAAVATATRAPPDCGNASWSVTASATSTAPAVDCTARCAGALWLRVRNCGARELAVDRVSVHGESGGGFGYDFARGTISVGAGCERNVRLDGPLGDGDGTWRPGTYVVRIVAAPARLEVDGAAEPPPLEAVTTFTH